MTAAATAERALSERRHALHAASMIRRQRTRLKLTLAEVAHRAGCSVSYLSMLENGKRDPTLSTLACIAHALQVSVGALLEQDPQTPHPRQPEAATTPRPAGRAASGDARGQGTPDVPEAWTKLQPSGSGLDVENFPSVLLLAAGTLFQRNVMRPLLETHGITVAEWRVLISLNLYGPATAAGIAGRSWMDKAQISRAALSLGRSGCIARRADPRHAKRVVLSPTRKGSSLYSRLYLHAQREQAQLLMALDPQERPALFIALQKLIRHVRERDEGDA